VFAAGMVLDFVVHQVLLGATYESLKDLWRPDMNAKMWIMWPVGITSSFLFTLIFAKGYENKGLLEGVRFGLIIGLYVSVPMGFASYAIWPIPFSLALQWFLYGTIELILMGVVVALVYGSMVKKAAPAG
jgi:hypothetical protein